MQFEYATRFEKSLRRRSPQDRIRTAEAIEQIIGYFETHQAPEGLGLKKLFSREGLGAVFEARATIALRILFVVQQEVVTFLMVGDHEEVRRFIRSFQ
jgi:hypothetical protein